MAMSGKEKAVVGAAVVDTGLVMWKSFKGGVPSLPEPGQFPLIFLLYGMLYMVTETPLGGGAVALGWLVALAAFLHVGDISNLATDLGKPPGQVKPAPQIGSTTGTTGGALGTLI